jgi:hypothetical protein
MDEGELDFKGQLKYEHFQFFFRKHWMKYIQPIFFSLPVGLLVVAILLGLGRLMIMLDIAFLKTLFVFFVVIATFAFLVTFFLQIINFYFDMVIVTDSRVIIIQKTVFYKNNQDAIDLTKIQDIGVESHGIIRNYLRYGMLIITLSTSAPPISINYVPDPHYYLEWANRVKREHILRRRTDRVQDRQTEKQSDYLKDIGELNT